MNERLTSDSHGFKRSYRRAWTTEEVNSFIKMWLKGMPLEEMADHFGLTMRGLNRAVNRFRKNGIRLPHRKNGHKPGRFNKPWTQEEVEAVIRYREDGLSATEIAEKLDRTYCAIQGLIQRLISNDVPVPRYGGGMHKLWDAEKLKAAIAGRGLVAQAEEIIESPEAK